MKGIFGVVGAATPEAVGAMGRRMEHRGAASELQETPPFWTAGCVGADPTDGLVRWDDAQAVGDVTILADGGGDARDLLSRFRSAGFGALGTIDAHFAFAYWNGQRLSLGRDFLGIRPLYYAPLEPDGLAFASEYKALLSLEKVPAEADPEMLAYLQHAKHLPPGRTLLRGIHCVPPGTCVHWEPGRGIVEEERLPQLSVEITHETMESAVAALQLELSRTLDRLLDPSGAIGLALSGGIDSIGLACLARHLRPKAEIHTFTAGYGDADPELPVAAAVARHIRAVHHEVPTPPALMHHGLPSLAWHLEDPFARSEALQLQVLCRQARDHVRVLVCGMGADGLFSGMPKYKLLWLMQQLPPLRHAFEDVWNLTQYGLPPQTFLGGLLHRHHFRKKIPPIPRVNGATEAPHRARFPEIDPEFVNHVGCAAYQGGANKDAYKIEKTTAASGLYPVSPFWCHDLMRLAFRIPSRFKIHRGKQKIVLRRAFSAWVPPALGNVPKFPQRMVYDEEFSRVLDLVAERHLAPERLKRRGWFDPSEIAALRRPAGAGPYPAEAAMRLWTTILTEIWGDLFLDRRGAPPTEA